MKYFVPDLDIAFKVLEETNVICDLLRENFEITLHCESLPSSSIFGPKRTVSGCLRSC